MKKNYVIDTNIFLDDKNCIDKLRNGEENNIFIPKRVLLELDHLKGDLRIGHLVNGAIKEIEKNIDKVTFIGDDIRDNTDLKILNDIKSSNIESPILVTNDRMFGVMCSDSGIKSEPYLSSNPFKSESEIHTGILPSPEMNEDNIANFFVWEDGKPVFYKNKESHKILSYTQQAWKIRPRIKNIETGEIDPYQNMAIDLLLDNDMKIVSLQAPAGKGKTFLALAAAFENVLQRKLYDKIIVMKPLVEAGENLGFLPGDVDMKIAPYTEYLSSLIDKLGKARECKRIYKKSSRDFDPAIFKIMPISFARGMDIENAFVIVDECQNFSRDSMRTILTRMGENTKIVLLGDTNQVDNLRLNSFNNGMNWSVKYLKTSPIYAHLVLKGNHSRGPICQAVVESGL